MKTRKKSNFWVLMLFLFIPLLSNGQNHPEKVSGSVKDTEGIGLTGVAIVIQGTTLGTSSDLDGNYEIDIPQDIENPALVFSYISFKTQTRIVGQNRRIDIVLEEEVQLLEELVVIGYGVQRKVDLTGSISSVKTEEIRAIPVAGIDQALQGRASGVNITSNTGMPGEGVNVRIRGVGSINSSNDPQIGRASCRERV